jgi:hypothetical protein
MIIPFLHLIEDVFDHTIAVYLLYGLSATTESMSNQKHSCPRCSILLHAYGHQDGEFWRAALRKANIKNQKGKMWNSHKGANSRSMDSRSGRE